MKFKFTFKPISFTKSIFTFIIASIIFSSCASYKKIPYFQDLNQSQITSQDITNASMFKIAPGDQLSISVGSLNAEAAAVFNNNVQNSGTTPANANFGYVVNTDGEIKLPLIGAVKVSGLTTSQLSEQLKVKLLSFLREPTVYVSVVNFKVAVMGDVLRPNIYTSNAERLTIPEALTLAGDLNITAKRQILLVREINGKREFVPIDLTSKSLFESPYFYLKSNDLIFVQADKLKLTTLDNKGYQNASLIIGALSVIAISISLFRHN